MANDKAIKLGLVGSNGRNLPSDTTVTVRDLDLETDTDEAIEETIKDLQVVISAIGPMVAMLEVRLVEALANVKDFAYYIPARFGRPWHPSEEEGKPEYAQLTAAIHAGINRAEELGVGFTIVDCGCPEYMLDSQPLGIMASENKLQVNAKQLKNKFAFSSMDYVGAALATVVSQPLNRSTRRVSAVQFEPTGQELVEMFTKIHGSPTTVVDYTARDRDSFVAQNPGLHNVFESWLRDWEDGTFAFDNPVEVQGANAQSLKDLVRSVVNAE